MVDTFIKGIVTIQKAWRKSRARSYQNWGLLVNSWNKTVNQIVTKFKTPQKINSVKRKYMMIGAHYRNSVLVPYLQQKKQEYNRELTEYFDSAECTKRRVVAKMSKNYKDIVIEGSPRFKFMPTQKEMVKLIKSARKISSNKSIS